MRVLLVLLALLVAQCQGTATTDKPTPAAPTKQPTSDLQTKAKNKAKAAKKEATKITKILGGETKEKIFRNAPRLAGSSNIRGDPEEYVKGLVTIIAWGIIPAVFALIAGQFYCYCAHKLCLCFSMKCCRDTGKYNGGWGCFSIPCFCLWLALIITALFCVFGYIANGFFSDYFAGDAGLIKEVEFMMTATVDFANGVDNTADMLNEVLAQKCDDIDAELFPSEFLDTGITNLKQAITDMNTTCVDSLGESNAECLMLEMQGMAADMNADMVCMKLMELTKVRDSISSELLDQKSVINDTVNDFGDKMAGTKKKICMIEMDYKKAVPQIIDVDKIRSIVFLGIFAFPLLVFVISFCGLITRISMIFSCVTFLQWFIMFVLWILFGIQMILGVVLTDTCDAFMPSVANYSEILPGEAGKLVQGCVDGANLADLFNIGGALSYRQQMDLDYDQTVTVMFPEVDNFVTEWTAKLGEFSAEDQVDIQSQLDEITDMTEQMKLDVPDYIDRLKFINDHHIPEIFGLTDTLQNDTDCSYLGDSLRNVEEQLCTHMINSIGTMTVAILVICIFSIPVIWSSIALRRRLKKKDPAHTETTTAVSTTKHGAFAV